MRQPAAKVVVVSRYPVLRAGLEALLGTDPERIEVLDGLARADPLEAPHLTVYDLSGMRSGVSELRALLASGPVVGLVPDGDPDLGDRALELGLAAVVPWEVGREELVGLVERVVAGAGTRAPVVSAAPGHGLSPREAEIVALIAAGRTNGEIADQLYLSVNSVKSYVRTAYGKLGISRRSHAVKWAVEHGLVSGETDQVR